MLAANDDRWVLRVVFDPPHANPEGRDEALEFYVYIRQYWGSMLPEELDDLVKMNGGTVRVTTDVLDSIDEPIGWVLSHTVPKGLYLKREADR